MKKVSKFMLLCLLFCTSVITGCNSDDNNEEEIAQIKNELIGTWEGVTYYSCWIDVNGNITDEEIINDNSNRNYEFRADGTAIYSDNGNPIDIGKWSYVDGYIHWFGDSDNEDTAMMKVIELTSSTLVLEESYEYDGETEYTKQTFKRIL